MADDDRRAEIEAVARALAGDDQGPWYAFEEDAEKVIAALDRIRDARGDGEGLQRENERLRSALDTLNETFAVTTREWGNEMARLRSARSPQGEDHEAGIEAAAQAVAGKLNSWLYAVGLDTAERVDIASYEIAEVALDAVRVRDARGDDEGAYWREKFEIAQRAERAWQSSYDGLAARLLKAEAARSSQSEDHEALRAAAKRVLEADMRGERDLDALNALEDAAGFTQQGQRPEQPPPDRLGGQPPAEPPEAP